MKVSVTVNEADYIAYNKYHATHSKAGRRNILMQRMICPLLSVAMLACFAVKGANMETMIAEAVGLMILSVIWVFVSPKMYVKSICRAVERMKKDGKLPYTESAVLDFGEDCIVETSDTSMKRVNYSEVVSVGSTDDHFFIMFGAMEGFVVPKRCVGAETAELQKLLNERTHCQV